MTLFSLVNKRVWSPGVKHCLTFIKWFCASLYLYRVAKYLWVLFFFSFFFIELIYTGLQFKQWLHLLFQLMYIAYIVVKRKKPTCSVGYVIYICNAHGIMKSHRFFIHLG